MRQYLVHALDDSACRCYELDKFGFVRPRREIVDQEYFVNKSLISKVLSVRHGLKMKILSSNKVECHKAADIVVKKCPFYLLYLIVLPLIILSTTSSHAQTFEPAHYKVEHVAGIWQRDYTLNGPASGAMFTGRSIAMDDNENIYVMDITRVRVITPEGRVWTVAGNGVRGFRDGNADSAMFDIGGRGYEYHGIALDSRGDIYIPDGLNNRIRKIYRQVDNSWRVETYAGGGAVKLSPGQSAIATNVEITNPVSIAVDIYDNLWTEGRSCIYKITPQGEVFCFSNAPGNIVYMQADKVGNVYGVVRNDNASQFWKITQNGIAERVAGLTQEEVNQLHEQGIKPVDGAALQAAFWNHGAFGVSPAGDIIYCGSANENGVVRRIKNDEAVTLYKDGWRTSVKKSDGWSLGSPRLVDNQGRIYLQYGPPKFLGLRRLVPLP